MNCVRAVTRSVASYWLPLRHVRHQACSLPRLISGTATPFRPLDSTWQLRHARICSTSVCTGFGVSNREAGVRNFNPVAHNCSIAGNFGGHVEDESTLQRTACLFRRVGSSQTGERITRILADRVQPDSNLPRRASPILRSSGYQTCAVHANARTRLGRERGLAGFLRMDNGSSSIRSIYSASSNSRSGVGESTVTWVDRYCPERIKPYVKLTRIGRPIGIYLLMLPGWWSIALAAPPGALPDLRLLATFAVGAVIMRSAGCTINDIWDKNLDAKVARTASRPLASNRISRFQALQFLAIELSLGLAVLLSLNLYSIVLGAASMIVVVTYPLMKRITYWPQAFLGLAFNWGALLGWSAVQGSCDWAVVLPLYAAGVCWTLVYDTIYAHQDKIDDALVGIRSTALRFGDQTREYLTLFATLSTAGLFLAGAQTSQTWPFYAAVVLGSMSMLRTIWSVDLNSGRACMAAFESNQWYGLLVFIGIVAGSLLKQKEAPPVPERVAA